MLIPRSGDNHTLNIIALQELMIVGITAHRIFSILLNRLDALLHPLFHNIADSGNLNKLHLSQRFQQSDGSSADADHANFDNALFLVF